MIILFIILSVFLSYIFIKTLIVEFTKLGLKAIFTILPRYIFNILKYILVGVKYLLFGIKYFISSFIKAIKNIIRGGELQ